MQIKLEFINQQVFMTVPPCQPEDALYYAFTSGYLSMAIEDAWEQLSVDESAVFELPVTAWRHALRSLHRTYKFQSTYQKPVNTFVEPLIFVVDGREYLEVADIPNQAEFTHFIGEFSLTQPELIAIDACYNDVAGEAVAVIAVPGQWKAQALFRDEFNGLRVALLAVAHESVTDNVFESSLSAPESVGNAGVDGGTCGFFDRSAYPTDKAQHEHEDGTFYKGCCDAIECKADYYDVPRALPVNIVPGGIGVNGSTFIGDGSYRCFVRRNTAGVVIAACLVFDYKDTVFLIPEEEEEDYNDDDC